MQNRTVENAASGTAMLTWLRCPWLFLTRKFGRFGFSLYLWLNDTSYTAKMSEEVNRKYPAMNSPLCTDPERHCMVLQTDRRRQTDRRQNHANSRSYCAHQYDRLKVGPCRRALWYLDLLSWLTSDDVCLSFERNRQRRLFVVDLYSVSTPNLTFLCVATRGLDDQCRRRARSRPFGFLR